VSSPQPRGTSFAGTPLKSTEILINKGYQNLAGLNKLQQEEEGENAERWNFCLQEQGMRPGGCVAPWEVLI